MAFYILRVLLPALLLDVLITIGLQRRRPVTPRGKSVAALLPFPLYLMSACAWISFYSGDPRFQGIGNLGLFVFFGFGVAFAIIRFCLGYFFVMELWRKGNR